MAANLHHLQECLEKKDKCWADDRGDEYHVANKYGVYLYLKETGKLYFFRGSENRALCVSEDTKEAKFIKDKKAEAAEEHEEE